MKLLDTMKTILPAIKGAGSKKPDKIERISKGRLLLSDGWIMRGKQSSYATYAITFLLNLSAAEQFRRQFLKAKGIKPSLVCLLIKASAIALKRHPWFNNMLSRNGTKIIQSSAIDIGVSIAGEENFTPVAVLREADKKSLLEIVEWLKRASQEARTNEKNIIAFLDAVGWLLPFSLLRRTFLKYYINHHRIRRNIVGTFQISTLHNKEVKHVSSSTFLTTAFLLMGGKAVIPVEQDSKIVLSPCVELTLNVDHRMADGIKAVNFGKEIIRIMETSEYMEAL